MSNFRPINRDTGFCSYPRLMSGCRSDTKMAHRLKTPRGRKLYALRKQTPQPLYGIIKSVMSYRQAMLRGLENVKGECTLATMRWSIERMIAIQPA
ncbi:MAG: transposase [Steroidobacteraceae bacterium]